MENLSGINSNIINFEEEIEKRLPYKVSEVICINCHYRWISVRPKTLLLKQLKCPNCDCSSYVIETGEDLDNECEESENYDN